MQRAVFKLVAIIVSSAVPAAGLLAPGCEPPAVRPVELDVRGAEAAVDYSDLAAVLEESFVTKRSVRAHRLLDARAATRLQGRLDEQLKRLAVTGPTVTPALLQTPEDRLAYWYNARAAWSLKLAMLKALPRKLKRREFYTRPFPLDGRSMSLADIDTILWAEADWRTLAAAPCVTLQRAPLPETPFAAKDIRRQIQRRLEEFIDDDRRFVINVARREILVPPVIWQFEQALREAHEAAYHTTDVTLTTALLPYVTGSPHRRLQDAIGYRCICAPEVYEPAVYRR